eukprot:g57144.t1
MGVCADTAAQSDLGVIACTSVHGCLYAWHQGKKLEHRSGIDWLFMEAQPAEKKTAADYCIYGPIADEVVNEDTLHYGVTRLPPFWSARGIYHFRVSIPSKEEEINVTDRTFQKEMDKWLKLKERTKEKGMMMWSRDLYNDIALTHDIASTPDIASRNYIASRHDTAWHSHDQEEDVKWGVNCYRSLKPFLQEPEYKAFAAFCELAGDIDPDSRFEGPRAEITSESITK